MQIGQWLRATRQAAGVSLANATFGLRTELPEPMWVSIDTVRRLETKAHPDPVLAVALARVYGVEPENWPEELRTVAHQLGVLLDPKTPISPVRSSNDAERAAA